MSESNLDKIRAMQGDLHDESLSSDEEVQDTSSQFILDEDIRKSPMNMKIPKSKHSQTPPKQESRVLNFEPKNDGKIFNYAPTTPPKILFSNEKNIIEDNKRKLSGETRGDVADTNTTVPETIIDFEKKRASSTDGMKKSNSSDVLNHLEKSKSDAPMLSASFQVRNTNFTKTKVKITSESSKEIINKAIQVQIDDFDELDVRNMLTQSVLASDSVEYVEIFDEGYVVGVGIDENENLSVVKVDTQHSIDSDDEENSSERVFSETSVVKPSPMIETLNVPETTLIFSNSPQKSQLELQKDKSAYFLRRAQSLIHLENVFQIEVYFTDEKRKNIGHPSVIKSAIPFLAVGTTAGVVVLFLKDERVIPLGNPFRGTFITSMDVHPLGDFLVAGFSSGDICLWNTKSFEVYKTITEDFRHPIESVCFLGPQKIIAGSKEGIKIITISKLLFSVYFESTPLVGYKRVENINVLTKTKDDIASNQFDLVAISFDGQFHVVVIQPFHVIYKMKKPEDVSENAVLYCDWRAAYIHAGSSKRKNAHLALGWGKHLLFFKVVTTFNGTTVDIQLVNFFNMDVSSEIINIGWMGEQVIGTIDYYFTITMIDPFSDSVVDAIALRNPGLVAHTRFDIVRPNGGIPRPYYGSSMCLRNGTFILLGIKEMRSIRGYSWNERIDKLVAIKEWEKGLELALNFVAGHGKAVLGLPYEAEKRSNMLKDKITDLLEKYIETFTEKTHNIPLCITVGSAIENQEVILKFLLQKFLNKEVVLMQSLEPYIHTGVITILPQNMLELYFRIHVHNTDVLEKIIMSLDLSKVDEKWLSGLCKQTNMYAAKFYLLNVYRNDYTSPIDSLLDMVKASNKYESNLFDYLKRCLNGAYTVRKTVLIYIFKTVDSKLVGPSRFPILFQLMNTNPVRFLGLLGDTFRDITTNSVWNVSEITRQELFNVFLEMIDFKMPPFHTWEIGKKSWPSLKVVFDFFSFAIEFIATKELVVTTDLVHRIFAVFGSEVYSEKPQDQEYLADILSQYENVDIDKILLICEKSRFYRIASRIFEKRQNYQKSLICHLSDPVLKTKAFDFIARIMKINSESIRETILKNLGSLIGLDPDKTASIIIQHFDEAKVLNSLDAYPKLQFDYLKSIIGSGTTSEMSKLLELKGFRVDQDLNHRFLLLLCQFEPQSCYPFLVNQQLYDIDKCIKMTEKYKIADANSYLLERTGQIVEALDIYLENLSERFKVLKKVVVVDSKLQDPQNKLYSNLDSFYFINRDISHPNLPKAKLVKMLPKAKGADLRDLVEYKAFHHDLKYAIRMCQRNSDNGMISRADSEMIWFHLLDSLIVHARDLRLGYYGKRATASTKKVKAHSDTDSLSDGELDDEDDISLEQNMSDHNDMLKRKLEQRDTLNKDLGWETNEEKLTKIRNQLKHVEIQIVSIRSVLEQLRSEHIKSQEQEEVKLKDPLDAANLPKLANLWLQLSVGDFIKFTLNSMIGYLDTDTILDTITKKYKKVECGHFKNVMLNLMEKSNYEIMIHSSIKTLLNKDAYWLFSSFFENNKRGLKQKWKFCQVCSNSLWEEDEDGIKMYGCGHSFHARCMEANDICPICYKQELKEKVVSKPTKSANDLISIPEGKIFKYNRMEKDLRLSSDFLKSFNDDVAYTTTILNLSSPQLFNPTIDVMRRNLTDLPPKSSVFQEIDEFTDLLN